MKPKLDVTKLRIPLMLDKDDDSNPDMTAMTNTILNLHAFGAISKEEAAIYTMFGAYLLNLNLNLLKTNEILEQVLIELQLDKSLNINNVKGK